MPTNTEQINAAAAAANTTLMDSDIRIEFDSEYKTMSVIYPIKPITDENSDVWHAILAGTQVGVLKKVAAVFAEHVLPDPAYWDVNFIWGDDPMYDDNHASISFFLPDGYEFGDAEDGDGE